MSFMKTTKMNTKTMLKFMIDIKTTGIINELIVEILVAYYSAITEFSLKIQSDFDFFHLNFSFKFFI